MAWTRVSNSSAESTGWAQSLSFNFTTSTGTNSILIVSTGTYDTSIDTVTAVTFNGVSMTNAVSTPNSTNACSTVWYLTNPPIGTYAVVCTFGGGDTWVLGAVAAATQFDGIDQNTPLRASTAATNSSSAVQNPYVDVPNCSVNDLVYGACLRNGSDLTPADSSDWTQYNTNDNEIGSGTYANGTAGTVQLNWTSGAVSDWAACGCAFITASTSVASRRTLLGVGV